jgi:hypothetical protein
MFSICDSTCNFRVKHAVSEAFTIPNNTFNTLICFKCDREKLNKNVNHCYLEDERKVPWPLGKLLSRFECTNTHSKM